MSKFSQGNLDQKTRITQDVNSSNILPLFDGVKISPATKTKKTYAKFLKYILINRDIEKILHRMPNFDQKLWLAAGSICQTYWNLNSGRSPNDGIKDYDLIYFDPDVSWDKENEMILMGREAFLDIGIEIEIRNQARVPVWYKEKFGIEFPPVDHAVYSVRRYPSKTSAIALSFDSNFGYQIYAPFGIRNIVNGCILPNRRLDIEHIYKSKTNEWIRKWEFLEVQQW